ncbi:MAG: hypothetical protein KDA97_10390 [Acidimicrobiales bacterium]|nr:hypothetical protein [Acidimicrobiales bacterium]
MARIPTLAATTAVAVSLGLGVAASPSAASCTGPALQRGEVTVDRGDTVTVTGVGWGDNCYDTGPPPEGEGVLGVPHDGIELVVVQGDRTIVVAEGTAGEDYGFSVDVPVPTSLDPGPARVQARLVGAPTDPPDAYGPGVELTVTDVEVPDQIFTPVAFEGATTASSPPTAAATEDDPAADQVATSTDGNLNPVLVIGGALAVLAAVGVVVLGRRRRGDLAS